MTLRIGGEFEIDWSMLTLPEAGGAPAIRKAHVAKLATGRSALYAALLDILARGGVRQIWLPAYICPSVVAVLKNLQFELHFYHVGQDLVEQVFPETLPKNAVFLYVHYFGSKNNTANRWVEQMRRTQSFFTIEDCVQASLNEDLGETGDYVLTSYRKFLPQPDGAYLGTDQPLEIDLLDPDEGFVSARTVAKLLRRQAADEQLHLKLLAASESRLDASLGVYRMSWLSEFMMKRTDTSTIAHARRDNWRKLSRLIGGRATSAHVVPVYETIAPGEVPLGFPVRVAAGNRDSLRRHLMERQIFCPVHWNLPHLRDSENWQDEFELSRSILTLPIDQRIGEEHLRYMVMAIESFGVAA